MRLHRVAALLCLASAPAHAQSVQYRSPAGVEYRAQADTGAIARAERALASDPRNVDKLLALGLAQAGVRQYREAIATFSRAIAIAPNNAVLYRWRGHRYLSTRQFDRALRDLDRARALDSTLYGAWYHLGVTHFVRGDFSGAAECFKRALPLAPDASEHAASIDWSWMSLQRAGRGAEAPPVLAGATDSLLRAANNAYARRIRLYKGEITADQVFTPADTADIQVATLAFGVGDWLMTQGRAAEARPWFERSVASGGWPAFAFIASEAELRRGSH